MLPTDALVLDLLPSLPMSGIIAILLLPPRENILTILRRLRRGKAPGPELDSLDIFIKLAGCYTRAHKRKQKCSIRLETLAEFFTILANGDVSPRIATILRTTYLVALSKDPTDQSKIRPLGIPSAIRRITAIATIHTYKQH